MEALGREWRPGGKDVGPGRKEGGPGRKEGGPGRKEGGHRDYELGRIREGSLEASDDLGGSGCLITRNESCLARYGPGGPGPAVSPGRTPPAMACFPGESPKRTRDGEPEGRLIRLRGRNGRIWFSGSCRAALAAAV
jgi:hypothetical protein